MAVNRNNPDLWKADIARSVDMYNAWFIQFAPEAFRSTRIQTTQKVEDTLKATQNLTDVSPALLKANPEVLSTLRMSTCPPLAVDRLIGLAGVSNNLVRRMEEGKLPVRMRASALEEELRKIGEIIEKMADPDIFVWLGRSASPTEQEIYRAATIVADRLCGAVANPIIRNAQERRQLATIKDWLEARGYRQVSPSDGRVASMIEGTIKNSLNIPVAQEGVAKPVNMPVDTVVMPKGAETGQLPLLIEAKSAGDFTNTNKRRKEEAQKMGQLRHTYGDEVQYILLLCGYFDSGYLGYEAAERIDWVWEHRIDDLVEFGL
jgi:type II restriction enzyme